MVRLGDVLKQRKEFITIADTAIYRRPRVQLHAQGIVLRDELPGALIKTKAQQVCRAGEFLVAEIDAKVGGFGIVPDALDGSIVSSHYFLFVIDKSKLDRRFFGWFVRTPHFRDQVEAQGSTNYAAIRPSYVLEYMLPLPPLSEQRRIVARIEELSAQVTEACRLRREAAEESEALSRASADAIYAELAAHYRPRLVGDVCDSITDGDHNTPAFAESGIPFIFVGNVSSGILHFERAKRVGEQYFGGIGASRIPKRGDVLYTAVGATLGIPAIVDTDRPFCFQRHIAILKPNARVVDGRFVWHMLRSRTVFDLAWSTTTGSAQPTVPLRAIRKLPIPIPQLSEQREVVARLDRLNAELSALSIAQAETASELDALMPAILDRAFKGEL